MKKFSFEFEQILEFRTFEQRQAEAELAKALSAETEIQNNLNQIALQYADLKRKLKNTTNIEDIISGSQFTNLLDYQKEQLLEQLAKAKVVSEQKREVLKVCMQKTTALEKLKEQQLEEYKSAVEYEESEFVDDLATMRQNR